jgi:hypothetical protein
MPLASVKLAEVFADKSVPGVRSTYQRKLCDGLLG